MIEMIDETLRRDDAISWDIYLADYAPAYPHFIYMGELCIHLVDCNVAWLNTGKEFDIGEEALVIPVKLTACKFEIVTEDY